MPYLRALGVTATSAAVLGERRRLGMWGCLDDVVFWCNLCWFPYLPFFFLPLPAWEQFICHWLLLGGDRVLISCLIHPRPPVPWHLAVRPDWAWSQACLGRQVSQGSGQSLCDVRQWLCSTVNGKGSCVQCSISLILATSSIVGWAMAVDFNSYLSS